MRVKSFQKIYFPSDFIKFTTRTEFAFNICSFSITLVRVLFFIKTPVGNFLINNFRRSVCEKMCRENERIVYAIDGCKCKALPWYISVWYEKLEMLDVKRVLVFYQVKYVLNETECGVWEKGYLQQVFAVYFIFIFVLDTKIYFMPRYLLFGVN